MDFNFYQLWSVAWPQVILLIGAFATLMTALFRGKRGYQGTVLLTALTYLLAAGGFGCQWHQGTKVVLDLLTIDPFGNFLSILISLIGLVTVIISYGYWRGQEEPVPEVFSLLLFSSLGMTLMVSTTHLLTFVLGLELMSLCLYIMVGLRRKDPKSGEAAFKYFLLGSVAAAFLLMGISFLYGATGTLDASLMAGKFIEPGESLIFKLGALLVLMGFAFKVAAVPLHFWAPDVYDGAPVPITGFMATGVKVAAFGGLIRVLQALISWESLSLQNLLMGLSLATMVVGNLTALRQKSLKRIMAYSSIAHAGYLLLGLTALVAGGDFRYSVLSPILFYLGVYSLLTLGVFAILTALSSRGKEIGELDELKGLGSTHPFFAAALSIFLISLAGIPPSAGFIAKYFLFSQAIQVGLYPLAIVGILTSAASLFYYLAPVVRMYFHSPEGEGIKLEPGMGVKLLVLFLVLGVFYLGILPSRTLKMTQESPILSPSVLVQAGARSQ